MGIKPSEALETSKYVCCLLERVANLLSDIQISSQGHILSGFTKNDDFSYMLMYAHVSCKMLWTSGKLCGMCEKTNLVLQIMFL
jgi:hypothetical protein